jgi:hypothetical protein
MRVSIAAFPREMRSYIFHQESRRAFPVGGQHLAAPTFPSASWAEQKEE